MTHVISQPAVIEDYPVDFSNAHDKSRFMQATARLQGKWRVTVKRLRNRRSDRQNRYYWPCFVAPFSLWLTEEWGETFTALMAHEEFKKMFLARTIINPKTGEAKDIIGSSAELDTFEFNQYLDKCADHLAKYCGIIVPEPSIYHESELA